MKFKNLLILILAVLSMSLSGCCTVKDDQKVLDHPLPDYPYLSLYIPEFPDLDKLIEEDSPLTYTPGENEELAIVSMPLSYWLKIYGYAVDVENAFRKYLVWKDMQDAAFLKYKWRSQDAPSTK